MKRRLLPLLACPVGGEPLELIPWEVEAASSGEDEVCTGLLVNRARRLAYPIVDGVPRLIVFHAAVHDRFLETHGARLSREEPQLRLPDFQAPPGEQDVVRSFSTEWTDYDWDGRAYWNLTPEAWFRCMRLVLDIDRQELRGKNVLEMGIGIGAFADHLATTESCDVVGVDLGYATDAAHRRFGRNPRLHVVQASVFAPPFHPGTFDFVYSFGVIHHTYSTHDAFCSLSRLPRPGGRLYVWVYSPHDEERTLERRVLMGVERVLRPALWRLPTPLQTAALAPLVPLYMARQLRRRVAEGGSEVLYGVREAMHAARDRFAPRYIHRHTNEEMERWFTAAGYSDCARTSDLDRPDWLPVAFTACTGVSGVRGSAAP